VKETRGLHCGTVHLAALPLSSLPDLRALPTGLAGPGKTLGLTLSQVRSLRPWEFQDCHQGGVVTHRIGPPLRTVLVENP
jgi:hypothetical protein